MRFGNFLKDSSVCKCSIYWCLAVACFGQNNSGPSAVSHFYSVLPRVSGTTQPAANIQYVQGNYATPQTPQSLVSVKFTAAQAAGDLNVVVVGWNDSTAVVNAVTDKSGNTYARAVGPTIRSGALSQSIYYAKNIAAAAAGANIVTVSFSTGAIYPDIRIAEYRGADPVNPVDVVAARTGSSTISSSGAATTTNPTDLIFAANIVGTFTISPGSGFTSRMVTSPDGDIIEDRMVSVVGSYSSSATLNVSGPWIMQMVAFRTPSAPGGDTTAPTTPANLTATAGSNQINLSWTASSDPDSPSITYHVERCQGAGCTAFSQIATPTSTTYSDTGIASGNYSYRVLAADPAGNLSPYSNTASAAIAAGTAPAITSSTSASGKVGTAFSYQITATNSPTSYGASGLPAGLSVNTGTGLISGTPTTVGTSSVTLSATNSSGTGNATLTLTITSTSPAITSATTASGTVGSAFSYQITATNSPTSYGASGLPAGLSVNTGTGLISGTPTAAGTSSVTLSATNSSGTGNATLTLTVNASGQLTLTPGSTDFGNVALGSNGTQSVTIKNTGSSSITISQANVAGNEFSISGLTLPLTLTSNQSSPFNVAFTPVSAGTVTGSVSLISNASNSPTTETLSGTGVHSVDVSWQPSTSNVAGYNVYRGSVSGGPYTKINVSLVNGTAYADKSVQPGQTYYYVATAVDSSNTESPYSTQTSAVVPSP